jgi:hypothetical protein
VNVRIPQSRHLTQSAALADWEGRRGGDRLSLRFHRIREGR